MDGFRERVEVALEHGLAVSKLVLVLRVSHVAPVSDQMYGPHLRVAVIQKWEDIHAPRPFPSPRRRFVRERGPVTLDGAGEVGFHLWRGWIAVYRAVLQDGRQP